MGRLDGKRAFITGAAGGIGSASARLFAAEGAAVAVCDIDDGAGNALVGEIEAAGGRAVFVDCDITDADEYQEAMDGAVAALGGLDILYNNAGGATSRDGKVTEIPIDEFWRTIGVDLFGTFLGCRLAIPHLSAAGGGAILNTTSIRAMKATSGADAYTAAKGGVITLTRALALECAPMNIRVNAIAPGAVLTPRTQGFGMVMEDNRQNHEKPLRTGRPEEIAAMALALVSDEASLVNGAILPAGRASFDPGYSGLRLVRASF